MQTIIDSKELSKGLSAVKSAIGKDPIILSCVSIAVEAHYIELKAFNGVYGTTYKVLADPIEGVGTTFAVPYQIFSTLVSKLEGIIDLNLKDNVLEIKSDKSEFSITLMDADEYPELPVLDKDGVAFDWTEAEGVLRSVASVASDEISKQILTGVCFQQVNGLTEVAATDSHRLVVRGLDEDLVQEPTTVPKELIRAAIAAFKGQNEVEFTREGNLVKFSNSQIKVIGVSIAGDYPKYHQLIPSKFTQVLEVEAGELVNAINLISPIANNSQLIALNIIEDKIELTTKSELGTANVEVSASGFKEDLNISFNIKYLLSGLAGLSGKIELRLNGWNQPVIISSDNYTYLIMPVQVRN